MTHGRQRDAGDTLIEILMAVMILGVLAAGFITTMASAAEGSGAHQDEAYAQSLAVAAAENVQQADWIKCATTASYSGAAQSALTAFNLPAKWAKAAISTPAVKYWTGTGWATGAANCHDLGTTNPVPNGGLQLVEVSVTTPDNKATEFLWLIKRNAGDVG